MDDTWITIGSGPDVLFYLPIALHEYPNAKIITTNYGICLIVPDYYFLSDFMACLRFSEISKRYQSKYGMKVITLKRKERALKDRLLTDADIFLEMERVEGYVKGVINDLKLSGLFCTQFALVNGAKRIVAIGHGGYPLEEKNPYWYGWQKGVEYGFRHHKTRDIIEPFWKSAVVANPEVIFQFYGEMNYRIDGPNVERVVYDENQNDQRLEANAQGPDLRTA